jgi:putative xylitol transport system ATP-binding protein
MVWQCDVVVSVGGNVQKQLLSMRGIKKSFSGVSALTDGSLDLHAGEIHALCGGNGAGKSTLLSILMGFQAPDEGEILVHGKPANFRSAKDALEAGVTIVQQELSGIAHLTVAENIFLGAEPRRFGMLDSRTLNHKASSLLASLGFNILPTAILGELSIASQQLVEIAKALSHSDADIIIFDEPTSAIGDEDTQKLFTALRELAARGKGIIYVSHRLQEFFAIADTYTVFKDGARVGSGRMTDITREALIEMMIGCELESEFIKENKPGDRALLKVEGISDSHLVRDVAFTVHEGEILGIYGLVGSGRTEILNMIYGLSTPSAGSVSVQGHVVPHTNIRASIREGLAYVTEDRKRTGLNLRASVGENLSLSQLPYTSRFGFIDLGAERALIRKAIDTMHIKTIGGRQPVRHLSGGNQQKVVLGRCALTGPKVLLLDEPTRGVDVSAKREIYRYISDFTRIGGGVLMVSSDLEEILGMSDRILILKKGRLVQSLERKDATQKALMLAVA